MQNNDEEMTQFLQYLESSGKFTKKFLWKVCRSKYDQKDNFINFSFLFHENILFISEVTALFTAVLAGNDTSSQKTSLKIENHNDPLFVQIGSKKTIF